MPARQMIAEGIEEIALALQIIFPGLAIDADQLIDVGLGYFESFAGQARCLGHVADRRFIRLAAAFRALDDPAQHAEVLAESRPEKSAALVTLEPIDAENFRRIGHLLAHRQPMAPIVAHVVAAERQHRHRIAPHHTDRAGSCRGGLGRQSRAEKSAVLPIERLVDQRNQLLPARAEKNRADRHAFGLFPFRRIGRALFDRDREARVGVRRRMAAFRIPRLAAPILRVVGHRIIVAFPPNRAVIAQRDVSENRVSSSPFCTRVGVGVRAGSRRHAEKTRFRIDRPEPAIGADAQPRDIVARRCESSSPSCSAAAPAWPCWSCRRRSEKRRRCK